MIVEVAKDKTNALLVRTAVMKTTGSAFENFYQDENTTLVGKSGIPKTPVDCKIVADGPPFLYSCLGPNLLHLRRVHLRRPCPQRHPLVGREPRQDRQGHRFRKGSCCYWSPRPRSSADPFKFTTQIAASAKETTLTTFAVDESASVQATMYNSAQAFLKAAPGVTQVSYSYPNKHYM